MTFVPPRPDFRSNLTSLRSWLRAKGWFDAARAFDEAARYHRGFRKDGQPEFSHQVYQGQLLRTLEPSLDDPETTFVACAFHDTAEDYGEPGGLLPAFTLEQVKRGYGKKAARKVDLLSKVIAGVKKPLPSYFLDLASDPVASVVKSVDRVHNQYTMPGAFSREKQDEYISETVNWILPLMKEAERNFPRQANVYVNLKLRLQDNISTLVAVRPEPVRFDWRPWESAVQSLGMKAEKGEAARAALQSRGIATLLDAERALRHLRGSDWLRPAPDPS